MRQWVRSWCSVENSLKIQSEMTGFPCIILHIFFLQLFLLHDPSSCPKLPSHNLYFRNNYNNKHAGNTTDVGNSWGTWGLYHPTSGSILQNYLKFIPKFPTHHSERSKYCNFWGCANSIIKGQKCRALEALEQQLSWSSRTTLFGFHYMNLSQQISENCLQM